MGGKKKEGPGRAMSTIHQPRGCYVKQAGLPLLKIRAPYLACSRSLYILPQKTPQVPFKYSTVLMIKA